MNVTINFYMLFLFLLSLCTILEIVSLERCKIANIVKLEHMLNMSIYYLLANIGFDSADNGLRQVCLRARRRSARTIATALAFRLAGAKASSGPRSKKGRLRRCRRGISVSGGGALTWCSVGG